MVNKSQKKNKDKSFQDKWKSIVGKPLTKLCKCSLYMIEEDKEICEMCKIFRKK